MNGLCTKSDCRVKDRGKTCHSNKLHFVLFCLLLSKQLNNGISVNGGEIKAFYF